MASAYYEILMDIISNGSNLVLNKPIDYNVLREPVTIAQSSGAKISVTTSMDYNLIRELAALAGNNITFIDGLD